MSVLRRVDKSNGQALDVAASDELLSRDYPAVAEYLTAAKWPDGKVRQVSTLLLLAEDGRFKLMVNDRANGRSAWFSGETVLGCLEAAERALSEDRVDWRASTRKAR
jgi:hypothetical protein